MAIPVRISPIHILSFLFEVCLLISCVSRQHADPPLPVIDSIKPASDSVVAKMDTTPPPSPGKINTGSVNPDAVVQFAKTLIGTPYLYASTDPTRGFDCSGFITYVFNHFQIAVPRSSYEFADVGTEVDTLQSRPGDIILFTGTDSTERSIGHMGIVIERQNGNLHFIHSSSGKAHGVVITPLQKYYKSRFVKVTRIFTAP